jgi:hypothetical protein
LVQKTCADDPSVRVDCLQVRGDLMLETGHSDSSATAFRDALALKTGLGEISDAAYFGLLSGLAGAQDEGGHPREALKTYAGAMESMDSTGRGGMLARTIMEHDAALVFVKLGETATAERMLHDVLLRAAGADRQGRIDWQPLVHYAETALTQQDADSAAKYFGVIVARADAAADRYWLGRGLYGLARAQVALGRLTEARATAARFAGIARSLPRVKNTDDVVPDTTVLAGLTSLAAGHTAAGQTSLLAALRDNGYFEGKRRVRLRPVALVAGETALALGQPAQALAYARGIDSISSIDSLTRTRSGWVGAARLLEGRAELAAADTVAARRAIRAAQTALSVGFGADHRLTRSAAALLAQLGPP